ncbi:MAG TPA: tryptophan--tRNA ligase, partial [Bacteroidetes bacterium]|nr:tryptophan--tRNA ligase [Bacteroidota bacterium]
MKDVLSAIQPTGDMHFGNYFGAVKNWVDLQKKYDCVFGVVDYHAITMP